MKYSPRFWGCPRIGSEEILVKRNWCVNESNVRWSFPAVAWSLLLLIWCTVPILDYCTTQGVMEVVTGIGLSTGPALGGYFYTVSCPAFVPSIVLWFMRRIVAALFFDSSEATKHRSSFSGSRALRRYQSTAFYCPHLRVVTRSTTKGFRTWPWSILLPRI